MRNSNQVVRVKVIHHKGENSEHTYEIEFMSYGDYLRYRGVVAYQGSKYELMDYRWYEFIGRFLDLKKYRKDEHIKKHGFHPKKNLLSDKSNWVLLTYAGTVAAAGFTFGIWLYDFTRIDDIKETREVLERKMDDLISITRAHAFASQKNNHGN